MERAVADVARFYSGEIVFGDELMEVDLRNVGQGPPAHIHAAGELKGPGR